MKLEELVLAKCINNIDPRKGEFTGLEEQKYYVVQEINIGQSYSTVKINNKPYNSILFEFYNDYMNEINIYKLYSPYRIWKEDDEI